jgi:hypothetical protein
MDVTWGLFEAGRPAWLGVRSGGICVAGYTDLSTELFALRDEVEVATGHVRLRRNALLRVHGASAAGVEVSLLQHRFAGLSALRWRIACDALAYDTPGRAPARTSPVDQAGGAPPVVARPRRQSLDVYLAPGGQRFTTLSPAADHERALLLPLRVQETAREWTRVLVEPGPLELDVWVRSADIEAQAPKPLPPRVGGMCGLGKLPGDGPRGVVMRETELRMQIDGGSLEGGPKISVGPGSLVLLGKTNVEERTVEVDLLERMAPSAPRARFVLPVNAIAVLR